MNNLLKIPYLNLIYLYYLDEFDIINLLKLNKNFNKIIKYNLNLLFKNILVNKYNCYFYNYPKSITFNFKKKNKNIFIYSHIDNNSNYFDILKFSYNTE